MTGRYLTDLADVVRGAGITVIEMDGWQTRARGSGGYASGRPTHVMCHHTASGPSSDGWPDANYCTFSSSSKPLCNLYLNRGGSVWICAAGATNTNGSGGPLDGVPADSMNTHAIGIEAGNAGTGEPWPATQQDAYVALVAALVAGYHLAHVRSHFEWAPGRKVDPAGPSRWSNPSGGGGSNLWRMEDFRADVAAGGGGGGSITTEGTPLMLTLFAVTDAKNPTATYVSNGMTYRWLNDEDAIAALSVMMAKAGIDASVQRCTVAQVGWAGVYVDDAGQPAANPFL